MRRHLFSLGLGTFVLAPGLGLRIGDDTQDLNLAASDDAGFEIAELARGLKDSGHVLPEATESRIKQAVQAISQKLGSGAGAGLAQADEEQHSAAVRRALAAVSEDLKVVDMQREAEAAEKAISDFMNNQDQPLLVPCPAPCPLPPPPCPPPPCPAPCPDVATAQASAAAVVAATEAVALKAKFDADQRVQQALAAQAAVGGPPCPQPCAPAGPAPPQPPCEIDKEQLKGTLKHMDVLLRKALTSLEKCDKTTGTSTTGTTETTTETTTTTTTTTTTPKDGKDGKDGKNGKNGKDDDSLIKEDDDASKKESSEEDSEETKESDSDSDSAKESDSDSDSAEDDSDGEVKRAEDSDEDDEEENKD